MAATADPVEPSFADAMRIAISKGRG